MYPRTSIDNARRVRQLAHLLQGSFTVAAGKKIVPHLPKVVGPWLAGLYDNDKIPARAAQSALSSAFLTEEKRKALWKIYEDALLSYAEDAILVQTTHSLSDERTTSPDDAEAKQVRVAGSAMLMLAHLIQVKDTQGGVAKGGFKELLTTKKLWEYAHNKDPYLRRGACSLAVLCCDRFASDLDWSMLSTCFIAKGLQADQLGSSVQFLEALLALTRAHSEIWTSDYNAKTTSSKRLCQFLKKGSQRGPESVWSLVGRLIKQTPLTIWAADSSAAKINSEQANVLIEALFAGVTNPEEPRPNAGAAWQAYVDVCEWLLNLLADARGGFGIAHLAPLVVQYVVEDLENTRWNVPRSSVTAILSRAIIILAKDQGTVVHLWSKLIQDVIDSMKLSLPESSKDFDASQNSVIDRARRFFSVRRVLAEHLSRLDQANQIKDVLDQYDAALVDASIDTLQSRNGKPYGAIGVLGELIKQLSFSKQEILTSYLSTAAPSLLMSPSAERLISVQLALQGTLSEQMMSTLLQNSIQNKYSFAAMCQLLGGISSSDMVKNESLRDHVLHMLEADFSSPNTLQVVQSILQNSQIRDGTLYDAVLRRVIESLSPTSTDHEAGLDAIDKALSNSASSRAITDGSTGSKLLSNLILLADSPDPLVADRASISTAKLKSASAHEGSDSTTSSIVAEQLSGQGTPISIFTLIDLAKDAYREAGDKTQITTDILPSGIQWSKALQPHMLHKRPYSLALTNPLQGLVYAVSDVSPPEVSGPVDLRDADDFSLALRLTFYVTKLLSSTNALESAAPDQAQALGRYYPVALYLVNEKLTLDSANALWTNPSSDVIDEVASILSDANSMIHSWLQGHSSTSNTTSFGDDWLGRGRELHDVTPESFVGASTFAGVVDRLVDLQGPSKCADLYSDELKSLHRSDELARSTSIVYILREHLTSTAAGKRLCNEFIAHATDLETLDINAQTLRPLILLNVLLVGNEALLEGIPTQRLVFLFKNLVRLLRQDTTPSPLLSEVLKLLVLVISAVKDIYGDHWEQLVEALCRTWQTGLDASTDLPILHGSLRLYAQLKSLAGNEDANDDLIESWRSAKPEMDASLIECLQLFEKPAIGIDQPRQITTQLLRRQLGTIDLVNGHDSLYQLMSSDEDAIQNAVFELLHRAIPKQQEQYSLDLALEGKVAQLPPELLELVGDAVDSRNMLASRRYLLSWNLLFDHFRNASYKLQEIYSASIKEHNSLPSLLDTLCSILRITSGRPLDATKFDVQSFELDQSENGEAEKQWLAIHTFYNCLLYLPSLAKDWFISQKNRVKSPLESWTQKHISPHIVSAALTAVTDWASTQSQEADDRPIAIKSSLKGSEVVASITVDPESPPISLAISLPGAYPLESPTVSSRTRVGVSEKNWQSWMRTVQIIVFSTGSIVEGLVAFRRNVQGALKGQSECAICYSIIGTDMQTPSKRCGTCRNTFHGSCLFRWFKSSNSSSCPLCRNNFNYA